MLAFPLAMTLRISSSVISCTVFDRRSGTFNAFPRSEPSPEAPWHEAQVSLKVFTADAGGPGDCSLPCATTNGTPNRRSEKDIIRVVFQQAFLEVMIVSSSDLLLRTRLCVMPSRSQPFLSGIRSLLSRGCLLRQTESKQNIAAQRAPEEVRIARCDEKHVAGYNRSRGAANAASLRLDTVDGCKGTVRVIAP